jgi:hypothetical protein
VNPVNLRQDGFTLSFGGADTPAPPNVVVRGAPASLTVGLSPPNPTNAVDVLYWVDDGLQRTVSTWEVRTDHVKGIQYFRANFPKFVRGRRVDYCPVAHCAGGAQVPAPGGERELMATFALVGAPPRKATPTLDPQFRTDFTHLASGQVELEPPFISGETPEGLHLDFQVKGGAASGASLTGVIRDDSLIELRVRRDGIGVAEMHLTLCTQQDALLFMTLQGKIDFGEADDERFVENSASGPFEMMARVETASRELHWLNRTNVLAVGRFDMARRVVAYDLLLAKAARMA